ncbi:MAG: Gfo/Idh/MocA family oxidoreductase [Thermoguttaceae bacterium]|jgi:predicted dehydrogenase|nr:Gfo/Idh/MocA family oxidoreductase [Thermoguttaceae bacterium]
MNPVLEPLEVVLVGGGMITHDQILPSLYHLQRLGAVGPITVCALNSAPLRTLAEAQGLRDAFPGRSFRAVPALDEPPDRIQPERYREAVAALGPRNLVVVAVPDHLHDAVIRTAIEHDQHVLTVKPLVLKYAQAAEIERMARRRGLFVGVEYHKRFDRRALDARGLYRRGRFGEFRCGEAKLIEPYYYRHSNFQNWFTRENSDPFTYVGCHYVDLVYFITGLRPVEVAVRGVEGAFPNGNIGYLWTAAHVVWENGAVLSVTNGLGYPDEGAGTNDQGLCMFCEGPDCGALLRHDDQFRGVSHAYVDRRAGAVFRFVSPDYFRLVPWEGEGLRPVGYGYDSIEALVQAVHRVNAAGTGRPESEAADRRREVLDEIDRRGILATPANSFINELVTEAARASIVESGRRVRIDYTGTPTCTPL